MSTTDAVRMPGAEALARRDPDLPGLATFLDADALSEALGEPVRVVRVRYKPGASVVVALSGAGGLSWAGAYRSDDKPAKTLGSAAERGLAARRIPGVAHGVVAEAFADRSLAKALDRWDRAAPGARRRARPVRHNPQRRLMLDVGDAFVKVTATPEATRPRLQGILAGRGLPVVAPTRLARGVTSIARWGSGDLAVRPSLAHARAAGEALAAVHAVPRSAVADELGVGGDPDAAALAAAEAVAAVVPELADRAGRLAHEAVPRHPSVLLHGDFTADQVLVGDGIRLIDFDRAGWGHPARDLGAFAAGELLAGGDGALAAAVLDGYAAAADEEVDPHALRRWTARGVLLRAVEPFRCAEPDWEASIARAVGLAEGLVR